MKNVREIVVAVAVVAMLAALPVAAEKGYKGFERGDALITAEELKALMDAEDPDLVVIGVMKEISYKAGHIPGSLNVWRGDYEPKEGNPWPFGGMMLDRAAFQEFARGLGVNNDSKVVVYDEKYDATRLWWAFFMYGKTDVRVLDGGYQAWKAAGYDTDTAIFFGTEAEEGSFEAKPRNQYMVASMDEVWASKTDEEMQLWDTREEDEWTGKSMKKGAFRKGRIEWATFQNWKQFKQPVEDGGNPTAFKDAAEIQKVIDKYGMDKNKTQIFYCQSGVRTTTNMFALYLMGWDPNHLANYDGSWIEWSYFEKNPVVVD
jgi:thiosulfate/3-mercaptopyruvate sulfurtransferase